MRCRRRPLPKSRDAGVGNQHERSRGVVAQPAPEGRGDDAGGRIEQSVALPPTVRPPETVKLPPERLKVAIPPPLPRRMLPVTASVPPEIQPAARGKGGILPDFEARSRCSRRPSRGCSPGRCPGRCSRCSRPPTKRPPVALRTSATNVIEAQGRPVVAHRGHATQHRRPTALVDGGVGDARVRIHVRPANERSAGDGKRPAGKRQHGGAGRSARLIIDVQLTADTDFGAS